MAKSPKSSKDEGICNYPKKIRFLGVDYDIEFEDDLAYKNGNVGEYRSREKKIVLQKRTSGWDRDRVSTDTTLIHEVVHIILEGMQQEELFSDEKFVDMFAHFLYAMQKDNKIFK